MRNLVAELGKVKSLAAVVLCAYAFLFVSSISSFWFNPGWTSDDAMQQVYQFNEAIHPGLFNDDFVSSLMTRYLTPIHYWLGMGITELTQAPIMTAHWMMLLQISLSLLGMFLVVRGGTCSVAAGLFAVAWLLHSRPVIQRLTAGLVRGWALPIFCFYLWAACTKRYKLCLLILLLGCFLHPPATFLVGVTHGLWLSFEFLKSRKITKELVLAAVCAPVIAVSAYYVTRMPPEIGTMISLEQAEKTPEMLRPHGRFAFAPLLPLDKEVRMFAFQSFVSRFYKSDRVVRNVVPWVVLVLIGGIAWHDARRRNVQLVPTPIWCFGVSLITVYLLSRELAFKLYVPDRHLQLPCAVFFIAAFSCAVSRLWHSDYKFPRVKAGLLGAALTVLVVLGSGLGLDGTLNFNRTRDQRGGVFAWAASSTPTTARFAGHPSILDPMMLVGARRAFITFETAHPFYDKYLEEARFRIERSLRAHFATDVGPLIALADAGNDYFVFDRRVFRNLAKAGYGPPFGALMTELIRAEPQIFFALRERADRDRELIPFSDQHALVVDLKVLKSRGGL
jgi:hypothetical protein